MDLTWNLDNIYTSFASIAFKEDMKRLEEYIEHIKNFIINNFKNDKNAAYKIEEF